MKCLRKPHPGEGLGGHLPSDPGKELLAPKGWLASNMEKPRLEVNGRIHSGDKNQSPTRQKRWKQNIREGGEG